ncbi:nineteen complex-related protein 2-domain-containing protein [Rostrohypoxylon terebratum]|nr:nineteen complex-related protein 2-domain-containing protein [Rostrohypoxylon terebratum]
MSAFGAKRKARKITVQDDDDDDDSTLIDSLNPPKEEQGPALQPSFKINRRAFKQSSLRKDIDVNKIEDDSSMRTKTKEDAEDDEDGGAPIRIRPTARLGSAKTKKRASSSRLSFGGPREEASAGEDSMILGEQLITPKRTTTLAHAAAENSAFRKGIRNLPLSRLPVRSTDTDEDRPRYSKEYLSELQMSTPNTPQDLSKLQPTSDDEMNLDPSELDGALIVETATPQLAPLKNTSILTEAEIRERKNRRARLAKEGQRRGAEDFIPLSDDENTDGRNLGDSYLAVLSRREDRKGKDHTRLVAEDEDLGEGFDEFVEDGGLSLGKRAEREARRKRRAEMASLITAAEGGSDDESDDSEAGRRAAYEAAQTRAGMDGLTEEREQQRRRLGAAAMYGQSVAIPKITPLPDLSVLVEEFKAEVRRKEVEMERLRARIEEIRTERVDIEKREPEVQRLLNEAGERYRVLMVGGVKTGATGTANGDDGDNGVIGASTGDNVTAARSLLDQARGGLDSPGQRGLESLGTTPVRQRSEMEL